MSHYEDARLYALKQLNLLGTPASENFDRITRMASRLFGLPIASINVAATNLEEEDFTERLLGYLRDAAVPVSVIELELTESGLISNGRAAHRQLEALIQAGFLIAIDDFGTGYSSLAYLQEIPAHVVKIDRSFIDGLEQKPRNQTLVSSMIYMAHDLGYSVVAEGVETWEAYRILQSLNCNEVQGFLFARPLSPADLEQWLASFTISL